MYIFSIQNICGVLDQWELFLRYIPAFLGNLVKKRKKETMETWFIESFNLLRDMFSTLILDGGPFVLRIALHTLMNS